ncbi:MAG: hypothetical protein F4164_12485 [Gemmatimonadales bacterium]|nr:hypothetical protein [Gemmatimonadales bacterium]MYG50150.1 hypothetical protein [Gemmatimonadales bacterium]MYK01353.1 hypothetical protein [Candidatus Palauibacter ramosifaciens]
MERIDLTFNVLVASEDHEALVQSGEEMTIRVSVTGSELPSIPQHPAEHVTLEFQMISVAAEPMGQEGAEGGP